MKLTMLAKDEGSGKNGCPSCYLDDGGAFVVQGDVLDADTAAHLVNLLPGETAVRIKASVIEAAVEKYRSGR
jgi:hypothetical protein